MNDWTPDALAADTAWMARLARRLIHDAAAADDLVQEAWMIALRRSPNERPGRAWQLVAVLPALFFAAVHR